VTTIRRGAAALALGLVSLAITACSSAAGPHDTAYTFHRDDSGIKVDTPALRTLKASTQISPCPVTRPGRTGVDGGLPDLTLPCLGGGPEVALATLRGPLLVNFWAQYCGPCQAESPLLEQLFRSAEGTVAVVGVDFIDPIPGKALVFAKERGLTYPQVADPAGAAKGPLRIAALPYTFFIGRSGKITYTQVGPIRSASELASLVREHLGVRVPGLAGSS